MDGSYATIEKVPNRGLGILRTDAHHDLKGSALAPGGPFEERFARSGLPGSSRGSVRADPRIEVPEQSIDELSGPCPVLREVGPLGLP